MRRDEQHSRLLNTSIAAMGLASSRLARGPSRRATHGGVRAGSRRAGAYGRRTTMNWEASHLEKSAVTRLISS